jgi:uncharacterized protein (TIGR02001 family)
MELDMKLKSKIALAVLALTAAGGVMAQVSYNVGVVSDYRVRGIAQTSEKPALQAGIDYGFASGAYVGTWASNVSWLKDFSLATKGDYEVDVYGGYKGAFSGVGYDVGLIAYTYPGNDTNPDATTREAYVALSYGVVTFKYNRSLGNFVAWANSDGSEYYDLSAGFDLGNGYTLTPHVGAQKVANNSSADYSDYALTLSKDMGKGLSLSIAAMGNDAKEATYTDTNGKVISKSVVVVGAKYSF